MKLLVRNLARTTTEDELRKMFEVLGKVQSCSLVIDKETGNSKGFAFIEMPRPGDAKAAVKTLNGKTLAGNIIRVKKAVPKKAEPEKLAAKDIEAGKVETVKVDQEKSEPEKRKIENVEAKKESSVNRNIWSK
jgi:RNA recognition motif-containing protein